MEAEKFGCLTIGNIIIFQEKEYGVLVQNATDMEKLKLRIKVPEWCNLVATLVLGTSG